MLVFKLSLDNSKEDCTLASVRPWLESVQRQFRLRFWRLLGRQRQCPLADVIWSLRPACGTKERRWAWGDGLLRVYVGRSAVGLRVHGGRSSLDRRSGWVDEYWEDHNVVAITRLMTDYLALVNCSFSLLQVNGLNARVSTFTVYTSPLLVWNRKEESAYLRGSFSVSSSVNVDCPIVVSE